MLFLRPCTDLDPLFIISCGSNPEQHVIRHHNNKIELKGLSVHMNALLVSTFSFHANTIRLNFGGIAYSKEAQSIPSFYPTLHFTYLRLSSKSTRSSRLVHNWLNLGLQRARFGKNVLQAVPCCPFYL
jgi:hypothetical protein